MTAITLHNVPEGMAVGLAFALAAGTRYLRVAALAMGIGIQNFPEGAAVALPLRQGGWSRPRAFAGGMLSAPWSRCSASSWCWRRPVWSR